MYELTKSSPAVNGVGMFDSSGDVITGSSSVKVFHQLTYAVAEDKGLVEEVSSVAEDDADLGSDMYAISLYVGN